MQTSKHPENCCSRLNQKSFKMNRKMFLSSILPAFFFVVYTPHRLRATQNISRTPHRKCVLTFCALLLAFFLGVRVFVTAEHCPLILTINMFFSPKRIFEALIRHRIVSIGVWRREKARSRSCCLVIGE